MPVFPNRVRWSKQPPSRGKCTRLIVRGRARSKRHKPAYLSFLGREVKLDCLDRSEHRFEVTCGVAPLPNGATSVPHHAVDKIPGDTVDGGADVNRRLTGPLPIGA